jgi:hypothetical protein
LQKYSGLIRRPPVPGQLPNRRDFAICATPHRSAENLILCCELFELGEIQQNHCICPAVFTGFLLAVKSW